MNRLVATSLSVSILVLALTLDAQAPTYLYSPAGAATQVPGGSNTIPWWGQSASYQQIHDYEEMLRVAGGKPVAIIMKGLGFRPAGATTLPGRTWELRLSVGTSPNNADNASATFTSNLPKPTTVFATSTTFSKLSFPTTTGVKGVSPIAFTVPFNNKFIYVPIKGSNFCWEWRHRNSTSKKLMSCDAIAGKLGRGTTMSSLGFGCNGAQSTVLINSQHNYESKLVNAPAGTRALAMIGLTQQKTVLPGWCSNLETVPLLYVFGTADSTGKMTPSRRSYTRL